MRNRRPFPDDLHAIFKQLDPQAFQQFAQAQQHWTTLQRMAELETHIDLLQEELVENDMQLKWLQPSAVALAAIARFQAYGVDDLDLLDTMLEHGETWLDQTLQLLEQCERLGLVGDSYTAWCEHALEGAYDWIASMHSSAEDEELTTANALEGVQQNGHQEFFTEITEEMLIRRLMSEDETEKMAALLPTHVDSEEDAVALASLPTLDVIEAQDAAVPVDAISPDELAETHTQPVTETLAPTNSGAASDSAQEQVTSPEILITSEASVEVADAAEAHATLNAPAEPLDTPETLITADMSAETPDTPAALATTDMPVEAIDASEVLAVPDSSDETLDTLETLATADIPVEVAENFEVLAVSDTFHETLDTPEALVASDIVVEATDTPEVLAVSDTSAERLDTPEALAIADTIIEISDVPPAVTTSNRDEEAAAAIPVEASNAAEILETSDIPDAKSDRLEIADEPLEEITQADAVVISEEASPSWEEREAAVETLEPAELFDASPMEAQPVAFVAPTTHEHDALDELLEHAAQAGVEEHNDLFNEYIETMDEPTDAGDNPHLDAASTPIETVSEEQHDPFTVEGTVTYLSTGDAGVQAVPDTSISKPRRRFFLWRLLARIFRRSPKKTS